MVKVQRVVQFGMTPRMQPGPGRGQGNWAGGRGATGRGGLEEGGTLRIFHGRASDQRRSRSKNEAAGSRTSTETNRVAGAHPSDAQKIEEKIQKLGATESQIARAIGVTQSYISKLKSGGIPVPPEQLKTILSLTKTKVAPFAGPPPDSPEVLAVKKKIQELGGTYRQVAYASNINEIRFNNLMNGRTRFFDPELKRLLSLDKATVQATLPPDAAPPPTTPETIEAGSRLRKIREDAGYTAAEFAQKLGRSKSGLAKLELGQRSLELIEGVISEALKVENKRAPGISWSTASGS